MLILITPLPDFTQRGTIVFYQFIDNRSEYENAKTNQYPKLKRLANLFSIMSILVDFVTTAH